MLQLKRIHLQGAENHERGILLKYPCKYPVNVSLDWYFSKIPNLSIRYFILEYLNLLCIPTTYKQ